MFRLRFLCQCLSSRRSLSCQRLFGCRNLTCRPVLVRGLRIMCKGLSRKDSCPSTRSDSLICFICERWCRPCRFCIRRCVCNVCQLGPGRRGSSIWLCSEGRLQYRTYKGFRYIGGGIAQGLQICIWQCGRHIFKCPERPERAKEGLFYRTSVSGGRTRQSCR